MNKNVIKIGELCKYKNVYTGLRHFFYSLLKRNVDTSKDAFVASGDCFIVIMYHKNHPVVLCLKTYNTLYVSSYLLEKI